MSQAAAVNGDTLAGVVERWLALTKWCDWLNKGFQRDDRGLPVMR